jgi:hypothetical protein
VNLTREWGAPPAGLPLSGSPMGYPRERIPSESGAPPARASYRSVRGTPQALRIVAGLPSVALVLAIRSAAARVQFPCFAPAQRREELVPGEGIEPSRLIQPRDFKSRASASSATRALSGKIAENGIIRNEGGMEAAPGFEPGIKDLQSSALPLGYAAAGGILFRRPTPCQGIPVLRYY